MIQQGEVAHMDAMGNDWRDRYSAAGYQCLLQDGGPYQTGGESIARVTYESRPAIETIATDAVERLREDQTGGTPLASF